MSPPARRALALAAFLLLPLATSSGCSGGSGTNTGAAGTGAAGTGAAGTGADPNASLGGFTVKMLDQTPGASQVTGVVNDKARHELVIWEQAGKDGPCVLVKPRVPFCSTACTLPNACIEDDVCVNNEQKAQDLGTVTFKGIKTVAGGTTVVLDNASNNYGTGEPLVFPPFAEGDDVSVETTGGALAPITIHAKGIAPLVIPAGDIPIEKNKPLVLTWTPKGASSDATIHVVIDLSHHGGTKGKIECDAPDTGSLTIAASLVTPLYNLGFSGYPSIDITRASVGTASLAQGKVQLNLVQVIQRYMTIPGLVSCTMDEECPTGQTCQTDLKCK
jgi:hypothetical protein